MRTLREAVCEFIESGYLETQEAIEDELLKDLTTKMMSIDPKDHLGFVSVRGQIEAIKLLRARRSSAADPSDT